MQSKYQIAVYVMAAMLACVSVRGATRTSTQDGYWNNTATWVEGIVPVAGDVVYVQDSCSVTVTNDESCGVFRLYSSSGDASAGTLEIAGGSLYCSVGGLASVVGRYSNSVGTLNITGGDLNVGAIGTISHDFVVGQDGGTGIVNQSAGNMHLARYINLTYGANSYAEYNLSDGNVYIPSASSIGRDSGCRAFWNQSGGSVAWSNYCYVGQLAGSYGEINLSGGYFGVVNTSSRMLRLAAAASSTGKVTQSGGLMEVLGDSYLSYQGVGEYIMTGGELAFRNNLRTSGASTLFQVSGGSVTLSNCTYMTGGENWIFHVVGAGCTNFEIGSGFVFDPSAAQDHRLRAHLGKGGITTIKVLAGNVDLDDTTLEVGVTNDFSGYIGDQYQLIRATNTATIYTNTMSFLNISTNDGYEFVSEVTTSNGYDWLMLECTKAPPRATAIVIK